MILALLSRIATATSYTVTFCVEHDVSFPDAAYGDYWTDNLVNRNGRGLSYQVLHDGPAISGHLSQVTGCATETVELAGPTSTYAIRVRSSAIIGGQEIESYARQYYDEQVLSAVQANRTPVPSTASPVVLPSTGVWEHLAVVTALLKRNKFHVGQGVDRDCCLESHTPGWYLPDGTCGPNAPAQNHYQRIDEPLRIYSHEALACGQSSVEDTNGDPHTALGLDDDSCGKFTDAHELGHVIVDMRMGGDDEARNYNASQNECVGAYRDGARAPDNDRGMLTNEYTATALREGWAEFYSYWAWNAKETNCERAPDGVMTYDIDLDGTPEGTVLDCWWTPYPGTDPPSPNIVVDGVKWLDDAERVCQATGHCACDVDTDPVVEANRATLYDVSKMLFHLYAEDLLTETELSDLYVDTCARGWARDDDDRIFVTSDDEWPLERLKTSAAFHGFSAELNYRLPYVER